jgi:phosphonate transport system permease protein
VFAESVDNVPYRSLESASLGGRASAFVYGALPRVRSDWWSYSAIQFESNVRAGVLLGTLGLGGLGERFHSALGLGLMPRAGTLLIAMVLLTALIDRASRLVSHRSVR